MQQTFQASTLVPRGFVVADTASDDGGTSTTVRPTAKANTCPGCGTQSDRVRSRYSRRLADLPIAGRPMRLMVLARRFHCHVVLCGRRIFAERFEAHVLAPWARRTAWFEHIVHHLGLTLGERPAASFARRLMVPVSNDTLLRAVRRHGSPRFIPPAVIGIDDWAELAKVPAAKPLECLRRDGGAISDKGRSPAISNSVRRLHSHPTASLQRRRPGSRASRRSQSSPVNVAVATRSPQPRRCPRRSRSPTAGTNTFSKKLIFSHTSHHACLMKARILMYYIEIHASFA